MEISLIAGVDRDQHDGLLSRDQSIARLRELAGDRRDVLALAAGHYLRLFLAHGAAAPDAVEYAARLVAAGADLGLTVAAVVRADTSRTGWVSG